MERFRRSCPRQWYNLIKRHTKLPMGTHVLAWKRLPIQSTRSPATALSHPECPRPLIQSPMHPLLPLFSFDSLHPDSYRRCCTPHLLPNSGLSPCRNQQSKELRMAHLGATTAHEVGEPRAATSNDHNYNHRQQLLEPLGRECCDR